MNQTVTDLTAAARLLRALPGYLRQPLTPAVARAISRERLERRGQRFVELLQQSVYANPRSPYRRLLALAGCELADARRMVEQDGLEEALRVLFRSGVYLTVNEYKARVPAIRGSASVEINPGDLRNPLAMSHLVVQTSGSRGSPSSFELDLAHLRERAVTACLVQAALPGARWRHARWGPPGSLLTVLRLAAAGVRAARWFVDTDLRAPGLPSRYRWSGRVLRLGSLLAGTPLPAPEHVPLSDPLPIAEWMSAELRAGVAPLLFAHVSSAVRVCQAAEQAGLSIEGAQFAGSSEPLTDARLAAIRRVGAEGWTDYGGVDFGDVGKACLDRDASDDAHVVTDSLGLIQPGPDHAGEALPARALLLTSLLTPPSVLINVSLGDQAELADRACGCPLEAYGWSTHLRSIRSFEKLTAAGMSFLDADVVRLLEERLPDRFGGGPTDYQLVEEELEDGRSRLKLLVAPSIGPLDEARVADLFLTTLGSAGPAERVMELHWRASDLLRVERRAPLVTSSGKILHVYQEQRRP